MKIKHDFHIHTTLSLCAKKGATVEYYIGKAEELGITKLGFSDHFWDSAIEGANSFYQPQNWEHVKQLKEELSKNRSQKIKTYFGCEVEYDSHTRDIAMTEAVAEKFDYVIVPNSHTHMIMPKEYYHPYQKHVEYMIQVYENILHSKLSGYITAMAHPFEAVCCPYNYGILIDMIPDEVFQRLFEETAEKGIAVEINLGKYRKLSGEEIVKCPQIRMFKIAKACGCKFLFGTDSHDCGHHDSFGNADLLADILQLSERDIAEIAR